MFHVESRAETITPEQAFDLLTNDRYEGQRHLRVHRLTQYKAQHNEGKFTRSIIRIAHLHGEPPEKGQIINGYHRLTACFDTGKPMDFIVLHEWYDTQAEIDEAYANEDQGLLRNNIDLANSLGVAKRMGVHQKTAQAAISAVRVISYKFDTPNRGGAEKRGVTRKELVETPLIFAEELRIYEQEVIACASKPAEKNAFYKAAVLSVGILTIKYQPEIAVPLFKAAAINDGLAKGDPSHKLREIVMIDSRNKPPAWVTRAISSCYNAAFTGEEAPAFVSPKVYAPINLLGTPFGNPHKDRTKQDKAVEEIFGGKGL